MRAHLRSILLSGLIAVLALGASAFPAQAAMPVEFIRETANEVLVILKDPALDSDAKIARIEKIAYARFDFETMSRLVLARNWRRLKPDQQREFVEQFKKHLSVTYGRNVDAYANESVDVTGDRKEPRGDWTVQTKILRGGPSQDILVDYRLRQKDGDWKVIDVVVERISLVSNFRSQIQEIISRDGVDGMLALLRSKNASGESILPEEDRKPGEKAAD
ncbi:MAG: ABC transporter substrate-binding protein [Deltaproteobacteria bacterium]|nr:ABC transporter substrate-binding protein [Deltaproteobacteria bacterium]